MTSEKAKDISVCRPIGNNLLLWTDSPSEASFPLLEQIRDIGFNMVELSVYSQSISTMEKLGREMDRLGLLRTAATTCSKEARKGVDCERDVPVDSARPEREKARDCFFAGRGR